MDKVTTETTFFEEKGEPKRYRTVRGPSAYQPNALPLGQTDSPLAAVATDKSYMMSRHK